MKFKKMLLIGIEKTALDTAHWKQLEGLAEKMVFLPKENPSIQKELFDADCLLVNFGVKVDRVDIDHAPKLKYIGILATAFGKVDVEYAGQKKIPVCNLGGYSTEAVAEFVFATVLERMRELERGKQQVRAGNCSETGFAAAEIRGKTFGILGLGKIGSRVAEIATGFGADVIYWSRNRKKEMETKGVRFALAEEVIAKSDILSIHLAQTRETERFLDEKAFQKLKPGCIVINTAPMELVDFDALEKRLEKGDITFILDHSDELKPEKLERLFAFKNCIVYPPIAYVTKEARLQKQELFVANIQDFLDGNPSNRVN